MKNIPVYGAAGLILFAHGARDARWADPLMRIEQRLGQLAPEIPVEVAFLDIMSPKLPEAVATLVGQGCRSITVVPIFLGQGGHVRSDLAALVQVARDAHPGIEITAAPAVGEDAGVIEALSQYCLQALDLEAEAPDEQGGHA